MNFRLGIGVLCGGLALVSLARSSSAQQPAAAAKPAAAAPAAPAAIAPPLISPGADPATFLKLPYDESLKKNRTAILKILTAGKVPADQEQLFDTYYMRYSIGRWTEPTNYINLPKFRADLRADLQKAKAGEAHARINDLLFKGMTRMATDNYHPVVRVNAMLMLGELNADDSNRDAPVLYAQAVPVMLRVIDDPAQLDAVRAAALVGLLRHARRGLREDVRETVGTSMFNLAKSTSAPGRSPDGHAWMRAQAIEVLGLLESIGSANVVANLLGQITADPAAPMLVRRSSAAALGKLNYQIGVSLNGAALAAAVAKFTITAAEAAQSESEQGKAGPARRLRTRVVAANTGITGLAANLKDPAQQKYAVAVQEAVGRLNKVCDRGNDPDILRQASNTAAELRKLVERTP
jgi:hypothetical protein